MDDISCIAVDIAIPYCVYNMITHYFTPAPVVIVLAPCIEKANKQFCRGMLSPFPSSEGMGGVKGRLPLPSPTSQVNTFLAGIFSKTTCRIKSPFHLHAQLY